MFDQRFYIAIGALIIGGAFGYYEAPYKVKTEIKTVEVEKKDTKTDTDTNKHKQTVITEIVRPDGTKEITTTITEIVDRKSGKTTTDVTNTNTTSTTEKVKSGSRFNISALAGFSGTTPVYGGHVSKDVLGPISVGAFGLTNGTIGASIGISF